LVDQPGSGGDRDTYEMDGLGVDVGHTFINLTKENKDNSSVSRTFGFYPAKSVNPLTGSIEVPGVLNDDTGHTHEVKYETVVNKDNFEKILNYIDTNHKNNYNLNTYNCTDFAIKALGAGGILLTDTSGKWPGGKGSNPGDLGEDIKDMKNKKP